MWRNRGFGDAIRWERYSLLCEIFRESRSNAVEGRNEQKTEANFFLGSKTQKTVVDSPASKGFMGK
jgi:hypothetical protein